MFAKLFKIAVASAVAVSVMATPLPKSSKLVARSMSFNNWGGFSSLDGFDNFYGSDNFSGHISSQTVIEQQEEVVCHSESIEIIQQRLLVLQEMAKRIITEQICEVETQTIVFEQFSSSLSDFSGDLSRSSGRHVGYDSNISNHFGDIQNSDGSLSNSDLGFSGSDCGSSTIVPSGSNWNDQSSPSSVGNAFNAAKLAIFYATTFIHLKMFAKIAKIVLASALIAGVAAKPLPTNRLDARGSHSFDNYGGISSFNGFDNFYGSDNFVGHFSSETVVEQDSELVCHSESVVIIQQRLLVLQEMAKRIITEQICEVETQTVVFEQFHASLGSFSSDLRRTSGHQVGYDRGISSHFGDIVSSDDSLSTDDFGFSGSSLGSQYVVPSGSNWNPSTSPASVGAAFSAAKSAI
ncbi:hypothetical protein CVT25_012909 [Psilocybe cyanescens]|uniref:Uncharacterized protein n=1 Tax=Psilocybe cyanescens TaxID=93625 RepID=A0A409XLW7_PSICY|nr:hypothetical protein CVT25_012909 [Psilocybe cyanescens]